MIWIPEAKAVDSYYNFKFSDTVNEPYASVTEGTPWYITWGADLCNAGNVKLWLVSATSTFRIYNSAVDACNSLNGGQPVINHLSGWPAGTYTYYATTTASGMDTYYEQIFWDGTGYEPVLTELDTTRFIGSAFDPYDEDTVATGTPVNLTGYLYLNEDDMDGELLTDGWWIEARIRRDSDNQIAVANITLLDTVLRIDDDWVATYNSFSTSTTFTREGRYTIQWTLHRPSVWNSLSSFFGLEAYFNAGVLAEYTTHVVAGELTAYDEYVNSFQEGVENSFASTTLSVLTDRLNTCNPLGNFSMMDCLAGLFTLDPQSSGAVIEQFRSLIATKAPMGYVTRLVDIITAQTATTSLPIISVTFPTGLPLAGKVLDFDFNQILADAGEIASSTLVSSSNPNENIWTVVMPFVNTVFYLLLFFLIINDITGMYRNKGHR